MRSQYIVAAFLVVLIATAGFRLLSKPTNAKIVEATFNHRVTTPAQKILLGEAIDINSADAKALEVLPLIGPKIAERIVRDRKMNGPFASVYDLARVYGVGRRTIERNLQFIEVK